MFSNVIVRLKTRLVSEAGATSTEYAAMLALIIVIVTLALVTFGEGLGGTFALAESAGTNCQPMTHPAEMHLSSAPPARLASTSTMTPR